MVEKIKTFEDNRLAIEAIGSFTEEDEKRCQKYFNEKIEQGFETINVLVKLDEMKISKSSTKAFMEDIIRALRNYKKLGHLAIVAHSKILKSFVPIDNLFFERAKKGRLERYFDVSQMDEAFKFISY